MDKVSFIGLWDIYKGLLTPTQQEITDLYFNFDLTLSEIADEKGITRQGASECLKTCKKQLEEYEEKLHFYRNLQEVCLQNSFLMTDAGRWADKFKAAHPEFTKEIDELKAIISKDYSKETSAVFENPQAVEILNADYTEAVYGKKKTGEE